MRGEDGGDRRIPVAEAVSPAAAAGLAPRDGALMAATGTGPAVGPEPAGPPAPPRTRRAKSRSRSPSE
ncbi:hypothetical protein GCM10022630_30760 [Thermobifida alba]